jgi:hypothetical protein
LRIHHPANDFLTTLLLMLPRVLRVLRHPGMADSVIIASAAGVREIVKDPEA